MIEDLYVLATTTPSLEAAGALEVLADLMLQNGYKTGLVTSEEHDPQLARRKFLGHVFCFAWVKTCGKERYMMPHRIGGPLREQDCWANRVRYYDLDRNLLE